MFGPEENEDGHWSSKGISVFDTVLLFPKHPEN